MPMGNCLQGFFDDLFIILDRQESEDRIEGSVNRHDDKHWSPQFSAEQKPA